MQKDQIWGGEIERNRSFRREMGNGKKKSVAMEKIDCYFEGKFGDPDVKFRVVSSICRLRWLFFRGHFSEDMHRRHFSIGKKKINLIFIYFIFVQMY